LPAALLRALAAALLLALPLGAAAQPDEVIAALGATELRVSDVRKLVAAQPAAVRAQLLRSPAALDRLVRIELFRRVLLAEARGKGWDKRPEAIERMERAREEALVSAYVDEISRPAPDYPSEAELRAAYEANKAEFTLPRRHHVAQIYATAEGKAAQLAQQARAPKADFGALARAGSEHAESAARGGDMGWVADAQMLPEVAKALAGLQPGEVSAPVRSASGWHIVKLIETREAETRSFEEMRAELAAALRLRRAQDNERRHYDELLRKSPIAVNQVALIKLKDSLAGAR
jgi:peptidylprolyl isomerase